MSVNDLKKDHHLTIGQIVLHGMLSGFVSTVLQLHHLTEHQQQQPAAATAADRYHHPDCSRFHEQCIRCTDTACIKCTELLRLDTGECLTDCPSGYAAQWSTTSEVMGRVCYPVGMSGSLLAAVAGIAAGAILCVMLIVSAMAILRRRQKRKKYRESFIDENIDRLEFLRQLEELRPQAEYFLQMLNDTRRQIRKLHHSGDSAGAATYHPVVRDLAKILILLNKPIELINAPPHDWQRLYVWAERVLDRYKPELAQLIEFLQQPSAAVPSPSASDPRLASSDHSTFKAAYQHLQQDPRQGRDAVDDGGTNERDLSPRLSRKNERNLLDQPELIQLQKHRTLPTMQTTHHFLGSLISLHEFDERSSHTTDTSSNHHSTGGNNPFDDTFDHVRTYLSTSGMNDSSLWLQDEFFKLGFRPQDEITTEL
ncbi:Transcript 48 [Anopheles darlingi]|uniref:Transcript 48 n=1 Tax=Anopheles darlingi TaxID=43151 RepID=W5JWR2_ANODA|nr:Transcript 48 [Anopheles darlingi]